MNILIIRLHRLGDVLQLTPMLHGLKDKYPESRLSFLVGKDCAEVLAGNPDVDEIISVAENEYRYWLKNAPEKYTRIFNEMYDLVSELRGKSFEIVINRQYEWGAMLASLVGAKTILGGSYLPEKGFYFEDQASAQLVDVVRNDRRANQRNLVDWACSIAGCRPGQHHKMIFPITGMTDRQTGELLGDSAGDSHDCLVAIQMGAARSFRQWGVENFAEIVQWLINEREKKVVLIGSEDEADLGESIERALGEQRGRVVNLIGRTSFKILGAVLERCECLITGDTGPMHLAAAVGTPVIALFFGTAYPWETGPYGTGHLVLYADVPCAPCLDPARCRERHLCKREITPGVVENAFDAFEAFRRDKPVYRPVGTGRVKLYVTGLNEAGEQILQLFEDVHGPVVRQTRKPCGDAICTQPEILVKKGDEVVLSFLKGDCERGFSEFAQYLNAWADSRDILMGGRHEVQRIFGGLLEECMDAVQNKDVVTLMDAIEYGFKPLLQGSAARSMETNGRVRI